MPLGAVLWVCGAASPRAPTVPFIGSPWSTVHGYRRLPGLPVYRAGLRRGKSWIFQHNPGLPAVYRLGDI